MNVTKRGEVLASPIGKRILDEKQQALLSRKISELALMIPGTRLEGFVNQLYAELDVASIKLRPKVYISDEWGCPDGVPAIGIPFYLAQPELHALEGELTGLDVEEETEIMMTLRHEAGHAFNYAYLLYEKPKWRQVFGDFSQPYSDDYKPVPFSAHYVRHLPGWYAQKHPDEDFAETFAVWLTPDSNWRERYAGTPALEKLLLVDELVKDHGMREPKVTDETQHMPVHEMTMTLDEWYGSDRHDHEIELHQILDNDLRNLFPGTEGDPAAEVLWVYRRPLIRDVFNWTGVPPEFLRDLLDQIMVRVEMIGLKIRPDRSAAAAVSLSAFLTALAMNYLHNDQLVQS